MNWGFKILIVYALFVTGIVFLVIKSSGQHQDLVTENYYEQELKYQDRIDETQRANALSTQVSYRIRDNALNILFPEEMKGKTLDTDILIYCIADKSKDFETKLITRNGQLQFDLPAKNKGMHEIKVTWKTDGVTYYNEHKMMIQ